jgi:hypothetical protein
MPELTHARMFFSIFLIEVDNQKDKKTAPDNSDHVYL